ncbi:ankyrin repeat domain-containing protein [Paracoccus zhejiangensis]|uniref:Uncharacterized protein n=1 Tax=Paracoccus zhejiangensis TaxID=1077935 RepID=A0A2H5EWK8_9RHOB|nr:ankyrin repeat domain-containing protein [Paracoccus zhejiangensis]AUH63696.1 hypothetical protein CX676_05580 [Paracoccus zhejiangensis]
MTGLARHLLIPALLAAGPAAADGAALLRAAASGDAVAIQSELATGTPADTRNTKGETALLIATHLNHVEAARALIEAGADVNAKDGIEDTPYLYAGARGHLEILRLTLAHGADLTDLNRFGGTALIPAAERGHVETVRELIAAGVDVNHVNRLGWTALMEAVILADGGARHQQIVALLLQAGADPNIADHEGVTPRQHAERMGFDAMAAQIAAEGGR